MWVLAPCEPRSSAKPVVSVGATNPTLKTMQKSDIQGTKFAHQNMKAYITKISHKDPKICSKIILKKQSIKIIFFMDVLGPKNHTI